MKELEIVQWEIEEMGPSATVQVQMLLEKAGFDLNKPISREPSPTHDAITFRQED